MDVAGVRKLRVLDLSEASLLEISVELRQLSLMRLDFRPELLHISIFLAFVVHQQLLHHFLVNQFPLVRQFCVEIPILA